MRGVPDVLKTREDFENVRQGVIDRRFNRRHAERAIRHWEGLLSRHRLVFDRELGEGEEPDGPEPDYRVVESEDEETGERVRRQLRREEDRRARIHLLGLDVADVEAAIDEMKGALDA